MILWSRYYYCTKIELQKCEIIYHRHTHSLRKSDEYRVATKNNVLNPVHNLPCFLASLRDLDLVPRTLGLGLPAVPREDWNTTLNFSLASSYQPLSIDSDISFILKELYGYSLEHQNLATGQPFGHNSIYSRTSHSLPLHSTIFSQTLPTTGPDLLQLLESYGKRPSLANYSSN